MASDIRTQRVGMHSPSHPVAFALFHISITHTRGQSDRTPGSIISLSCGFPEVFVQKSQSKNFKCNQNHDRLAQIRMADSLDGKQKRKENTNDLRTVCRKRQTIG